MKQFVAILAILSTPAHAEGWKSIGTNQAGVDYLVKQADTANRSNVNPVIWVKTDNSREADHRWNSTLSQMQFDCGKQTLQLIATYSYDAAGKALATHAFPLGQRRLLSIPAGSIWADVSHAVCPARTEQRARPLDEAIETIETPGPTEP